VSADPPAYEYRLLLRSVASRKKLQIELGRHFLWRVASCQTYSIENSFFKPVKQLHRVAARQMKEAIREQLGISIAEELKQFWIDKR
jgi:hypothetical protein